MRTPPEISFWLPKEVSAKLLSAGLCVPENTECRILTHGIQIQARRLPRKLRAPKTSTSDALKEKIAAARELAENPKAGCAKKNIKEKEELEYYSCKIVEIKGGNRRLLGNAEFSMPAQADVPENIVLAECGETRIVAEISKRQN